MLVVVTAVVAVLGLLAATRSAARRSAVVDRLTPALPFDVARAHVGVPGDTLTNRLPTSVPFDHDLRPGQTLGSVLRDAGMDEADSRSAVDAAAELIDLRRLRAGDPYTVYYDRDGVAAVHLAIRRRGRLELDRGGDDWVGEFRPYRRHVELRAIRGRLDGPLESAIVRAGGEASLAFLMADVLQWDLDFNRDLRLNDTFEVLYERVYLDQRLEGLGRVLALTYTSGERQLAAFMFGDNADYYDADGRPLQKMFLRSPMPYSRVTSGFSGRRFHPVLKTYRPHYGVDYGAPAGTPVRVTANGVVDRAGWEKGGGNVVRVRHANGYLTAYLHLSGFAEGVTAGARVRQGDVVGYVGSTGLATAAHLDYRVQLAGRWIDPQSMKNEPARPISQQEAEEFAAWRDALVVSLREGRPRAEVLTAMSSADAGGDAVQ